jgi:hypothetical protein
MNGGTNLFDLAAKISLDDRDVEKKLTSQQKHVKELTKDYEKLDKAVSSVGKSGGTDSLAKLKQEQAQWSAQFRSDMQQLSQKAAALTGDAEGMAAAFNAAVAPVTALTIALAVNVTAVVAVHTAMLNLAVSTAKTQAEIALLAKKHKASTDTIQAGQILAAQSGRSLNDVLKESHGDLEVQITQFKRLGLIMSGSAVDAGKQFNDQLIELQFQWQVLEAQFGRTIIPRVSSMVKELSKSLRENEQAVNATATGVGLLAAYLAGNLTSAMKIAGAGLIVLQGQLKPLVALMQFIKGMGADQDTIGPVKAPNNAGINFLESLRGMNFRNLYEQRPDPKIQAMMDKLQKKPERGVDPASTELRIAELTLKNSMQQLGAAETALKRSLDRREISIGEYVAQVELLENSRHMKVLAGLIAEENAAKKLRKDDQQRIQLKEIENKGYQETIRHAQALAEIQDSILGVTRQRVILGDDLVKQAERLRRVNQIMLQDLGGGSFEMTPELRDSISRPRSTSVDRAGAAGATRGRVVTAEEAVLRDRLEDHREKIAALAADLTTILSTSIHSGFRAGMEGIMDIIENVLMRKLQTSLEGWLDKLLGPGGIFGGSGSGTSSGGGIAAILGQIGIAGMGGTSGGFAGGFASGGTIPMGMWGKVHAGESVRATPTGAQVIPSRNGIGDRPLSLTVIINGGVGPGGMSKDTAHQVSKQLGRMMQKAALSG